MKKNTMMRVASILLVAVLLTTCAISGTFAKYVTTRTGGDDARVAYWGFDQEGTIAIELFKDKYDGTVDSENGDNVVAPGTSKTTEFAFGYTPKGAEVNSLTAGAIAAPEVAYTFTVAPTMSGDYKALDDNQNFVWTLGLKGEEAKKYSTVDELLDAIKALAGNPNGVREYQPGQLPAAFTEADQVYVIGWEWLYEGNDNDADDTAMGNAQNLADVTFSITISAVQKD